jgi:hypothetical protein
LQKYLYTATNINNCWVCAAARRCKEPQKTCCGVLAFPCGLQGLLADWQSLFQQVGSLSDQAARRFDDQLQASQNMAALVASTMATIADATVAAQRLQEKYVQQTLLMQAGGDDVEWSCNRTSKLVAQFSINRCAASRLLVSCTLFHGCNSCSACSTAVCLRMPNF